MFHVNDTVDASPRAEITLVNLTVDRNNNAKAAVGIRQDGIANLYHVAVMGRDKDGGWGWKALQIDNGYDTPGSVSEINAYDVELVDHTVVKIGAQYNTYAKFNYDSDTNVTEVIYDIRGGSDHSNILINSADVDSAVATVTYDGKTVGYRSFADAMAVVNAPTILDGDYTVTLLEDCAEDVSVKQQDGVNVTVTAANKTDIEYTGTIFVSGGKKLNATETLRFLYKGIIINHYKNRANLH